MWSAWPRPVSCAACTGRRTGFDKIPGRYLRHVLGMLLVGVLIYALMRWGGHYYVEGVGYATIQATLTRPAYGRPGSCCCSIVCKLFATSVSLGSGSSGGIFSPSLFMGATLGGAFAALASMISARPADQHPGIRHGGHGQRWSAAPPAPRMTAVAMIFEMTRDYDIVLPMILAVAVGLGVRRMLSRENIYTMKLVRRGHPIPKALHANMFLVRSAGDVMDRDFMLVDEATSFDDFMRLTEDAGGMRHVVITRGNLIVGVLRVNTALRRTVSAAAHDVTMGVLAQRNFTIVRSGRGDVRRDRAAVAPPRCHGGRRRGAPALRAPTTWLASSRKEHIADEVARSVRVYTR